MSISRAKGLSLLDRVNASHIGIIYTSLLMAESVSSSEILWLLSKFLFPPSDTQLNSLKNNFNANLKLFLRLSNCASVGEKTLIIVKMHDIYVKFMVLFKINLCHMCHKFVSLMTRLIHELLTDVE